MTTTLEQLRDIIHVNGYSVDSEDEDTVTGTAQPDGEEDYEPGDNE